MSASGEKTGRLSVRFWGVRGSIPCSGPETARFGGNTSCVEMRAGKRVMIFDGGTGIVPLGRELLAQGVEEMDIFLSHAHLDHIMGLPFFAPLYDAGIRIRLWSGHLRRNGGTASILDMLMKPPLLPITPKVLRANLTCRDFTPGDTLTPVDGVQIATCPLNHPNGAVGYRVNHAGRAACYVTDTEHVPGQLDTAIVELARDAGLLIYDATYTEEEYAAHAGYGHSTWQEGVRVATAAGVERLAIFHHEPRHDDAFMDKTEAAAKALRPGTLVAREGMELDI